MIQFDVEPGAAQIVLGHGAQHCRQFLRILAMTRSVVERWRREN